MLVCISVQPVSAQTVHALVAYKQWTTPIDHLNQAATFALLVVSFVVLSTTLHTKYLLLARNYCE